MFNRRNCLQGLLGLGGFALVGSRGLSLAFGEGARGARDGDPHFFLQLYYDGGVDASYLFDARDPALRAAGLAHSYMVEDPFVWEGVGGGRTLASALTRRLLPLRDYFSVINGVVMATEADGHLENRNKLFTGSVVGGTSYLSRIGAAGGTPLELVELGSETASLAESSKRAVLPSSSLTALLHTLEGISAQSSPADQFILARAAAIGGGPGSLSAGARAMASGFADAAGVAERFRQVQPVEPVPADEEQAAAHRHGLHYAIELFRAGLARSVSLSGMMVSPFDTHGVDSARDQPNFMGTLCDQIGTTLETLRATPYDAQRSFLDVTTVLFSSEFSRTLRQPGVPIDETGTDHNPLGNSLIVAGKGIRGGMVVGATDLCELDASGSGFADVSPYHLSEDVYQLQPLGRPVDADTLLPQPALSAGSERRIHVTSVANTLMAAFGLPESDHTAVPMRGLPMLRPLLV